MAIQAWSILILLCVLFLSVFCEDLLKVEPPVLAVVEGDPAEFVCTNTSKIQTDIIWTYSNNTVVDQEKANVSIVTVNKLRIEKTRMEDKGNYICTTINGTFQATAELKVYWTPKYFTEGMIVVGINAALLVIFLLCFTYHYVRNRRKL